MKCIYVLCLVAAAAYGQETYSAENDNLDIDAVVQNVDSLGAYSGCFLDRIVCDPVPGAFKVDMEEAVSTACLKCTTAQKHIFEVFLEALKEKLPDDYEAFKAKYDPEKKYFEALEAVLASS